MLMIFNQPINPACINLTSPGLSDKGVIIRSIIPANCQNSDRAYPGQHPKHISTLGFCYKDGRAEFCYKNIGRTKSGLDVISTAYNPGGDSWFLDWRVYRYNKPQGTSQKVLTLLKITPTGTSRSSNAVVNLHISGNMLMGDYFFKKGQHKKWDLSKIR